MRHLVLIVIFVFSTAHVNADTLFYQEYKYELIKAKKSFEELEGTFIEVCKKYDSDKNLLAAVIFPELVRYSSFRDLLETGVLEALYIEKGSDVANFSIGKFQMKPSFIAFFGISFFVFV